MLNVLDRLEIMVTVIINNYFGVLLIELNK